MNYATIDGFEQLTAQEVFDISAKHLLKQNKHSVEYADGGACQYRGVNGLMCAAGPFLKDEEALICEGYDWPSLLNMARVPDVHYELVCDLQEVHDYKNPKDWYNALMLVANTHQLVFPNN